MSNYGYSGDSKFRPLSPWAYFGYQILFSIPILGFIFLIVFALSGDNINRRNFARSYFCILVIAIIIFAIVMAIIGGSAGIEAIIQALQGVGTGA